MQVRTIRSVNVRGKRVILRVDMNVPFDAQGRILDDFRIRESLITIRWILARGGRVFVIMHRGRPKEADPRLSIRPIAQTAARLLKRPVALVRDPIRENPAKYHTAPIIFCENIRFFPGEEKNSAAFVKALARWGDLYVNDAFAVSHHPAASLTGLPRLLPAYAGLLLAHEVQTLHAIFARPKRPFLVILGGAKISTKIPYIPDFLKKADQVVLGGALFNTVLAAEGKEVGTSLVEPAMYRASRKILHSKKLLLPKDVVILTKEKKLKNISTQAVGRSDYILDLGEKVVREISSAVGRAGTILWNGSLGNTNLPKGNRATKTIFVAIKKSRARVVLGGGDLDMVDRNKKSSKRIFVSTGGGAMLEFVARGTLPVIEALKQK